MKFSEAFGRNLRRLFNTYVSYLRVMEENKRQVLLPEKMEKELLIYLENLDTISTSIRMLC